MLNRFKKNLNYFSDCSHYLFSNSLSSVKSIFHKASSFTPQAYLNHAFNKVNLVACLMLTMVKEVSSSAIQSIYCTIPADASEYKIDFNSQELKQMGAELIKQCHAILHDMPQNISYILAPTYPQCDPYKDYPQPYANVSTPENSNMTLYFMDCFTQVMQTVCTNFYHMLDEEKSKFHLSDGAIIALIIGGVVVGVGCCVFLSLASKSGSGYSNGYSGSSYAGGTSNTTAIFMSGGGGGSDHSSHGSSHDSSASVTWHNHH